MTVEERLWLETHSLYNRRYSGDIFNRVVENKIPKSKWLCMKISIESVLYNKRIIPIIIVPGAKGKIVFDQKLRDLFGRVKPPQTPVSMLGIEIEGACIDYTIKYVSDFGLYGISYECDYYDDKMRLNKRESSSTGNPCLAIRREVIDERTIKYYCKSPVSDSFEALIFIVSWNVIE